jgi:hypothetical protein
MASSLYRLWHTIQDMKEDADRMKDSELVLLVGMIELLVEERTAGLMSRGAALAEVAPEAFPPDAKARALLRGVKLSEEDLKSSGGTYSLPEVQALMRGVSRQAVNKRVQEGSLLAVPGPSNRASYPAVQFTDAGMPVRGLKELREALETDNSWAILNFLVNHEPKLEGRRPIDLLKSGELDLVLDVARRFGVQGA